MSGLGFANFEPATRSGKTLRENALEWLHRIEESKRDDPALWISTISKEQLLERIRELENANPETLPLFGMPFAVKDNIDVRGFPTTAACPAFAYEPAEDAAVVRELHAAGAICMGKTNLDQFATGLVGTRSPYGTPRNPHDPSVIPGGSSSGSAVAVARGLVAFALGTDTAGSGRVPAALCGITGWKPTRGLLSTRGVVPACRSLDCVSVFAKNAEDIIRVANVVSRFDPLDPWSRRGEQHPPVPIRHVAVPLPDEMQFFGDDFQRVAWGRAIKELIESGLEVVELSFAKFFEAARLLYEGPWVAERYLATRSILESQPEAMLPITRSIIEAGGKPSALDAFAAQYRLAELRRATESVWEKADALCLPTIGRIYKLDEIAAEPVRFNSNLGLYTNFFNLLDLCGLAVPCGKRVDGLPFGITFAAPAWNDYRLLAHAVGRTVPLTSGFATMELGVFGAHMRGLPLEHRLRALGGKFLRHAKTAPVYRMVALDAMRPGVFRVKEGGASLELEIWELPRAAFGELLAETPAPLSLGRVLLANKTEVCGFLCEPAAAGHKPDITHYGGWRNRPQIDVS